MHFVKCNKMLTYSVLIKCVKYFNLSKWCNALLPLSIVSEFDLNSTFAAIDYIKHIITIGLFCSIVYWPNDQYCFRLRDAICALGLCNYPEISKSDWLQTVQGHTRHETCYKDLIDSCHAISIIATMITFSSSIII